MKQKTRLLDLKAARKNILMLGWEFPPVFTGGLGVACFNIVQALSKKANVNLVIPFTGSQAATENVSITGLNNPEGSWADESIGEELEGYSLTKIPVMLSPYPDFGGMGKSTRHGHASEFKLTASATWRDVSNYYFQTRDLYGPDIHNRTYLFAKAVKLIASKSRFDVVHAHDWPTFRAALEVRYHFQKPLVLHIHSLETDRSGEGTRNDIYDLERHAMELADRVIAVSDYTRHQIVQHYGIDEDKIAVALNGAEITRRSAFKKKADEKWITFAGRITFQKGPHFVVETATKLVKVCPEARFVMAGDGDMFRPLVHEVARARMGKYFLFTGFLSREKIKDLLAASDAYFMPSVSEPFGLSAVEAVQQGTASVISNRSGAREVLHHALHADFWDTDRFANYLYALLRYPALKTAMSMESFRDIEDLTWDHTVEKIIDVYDELLTP